MATVYREGDWFAVPLDGGGYGTGLIARAGPRSRVILAYLFGPRSAELPSVDDFAVLGPQDALAVLRAGDLDLINGNWPIVASSQDWDRTRWPMPMFGKLQELTDIWWVVRYSEDIPQQRVSEERADVALVQGLPRDGL